MPYQSSRIGPILLVRFTERLDATDCLALPEEARVACERGREPVSMVAIVTADLSVPSAHEREAFARAALAMRRSCRVIYVAIEGAGFGRATITSVFSGLTVYPGQPPITMHASGEAALRALATALVTDPVSILRTARFQGMIL